MKKLQYMLIAYGLCLLYELAQAVPAGVLPYAQLDGKYVVLLGMDCHRQGYWIDFGGSRDRRETACETAAREFSEETMFCFFPHVTDVKNRLRSIAPIVAPNGYHMYPLQVTFVQDIKARRHIKWRVASIHWLKSHHVEKTDYAWVWADDLRKACICDHGKLVTLKAIDGRAIKLHNLLAQTLATVAGQQFLFGL